MDVHDFHEDNARSLKVSRDPMVARLYARAFPDCYRQEINENPITQRLGIDKTLFMRSGARVIVDEKFRFRDYDDIALEYLSDKARGSPGWIEKGLHIDYIAYIIVPAKRLILLPWELLRIAWRQNKQAWIVQFRSIEAVNGTYVTVNLIIPLPALWNALGRAAVVDLTADEQPQSRWEPMCCREVRP